jgi:tetratricopeptide (TPR) repeat protein
LWNHTLHQDYLNAEALHNLAGYYWEKDLHNRAAVYLQQVARLFPDYYLAQTELGIYYTEKGFYDLAQEKFLSSLRINPDYEKTIYNLGKVYFKKGEYNRGLFMFFRATYVNPYFLPAFSSIVSFYIQSGQWDAAAENAYAMIMKFPTEPAGYAGLAKALEGKGDLRGAIAIWQQVLKNGRLQELKPQKVNAEVIRLKRMLNANVGKRKD